ncbi:MAG: immunity 22 family protein [Planctomycetia bacterium]|nr:immunity 22 family protein [Planctomycetia bacterium]
MQEDKRVEGAVSLWVGVSPSREALENYVEIDYSTGDLSRLSQLADDFATGFYDEDFVDISFHERATRSLPDLLRRCSYASLIIPKFVERCGEFLPMEVNSAVLFYDFRHHGSPRPGADAGRPVKLRYMGSITVQTPWPD